MKILVTGTEGFIGFHLAKKLLGRGDEIVGLYKAQNTCKTSSIIATSNIH